MKQRQHAQIRVVNGVRERLCRPCGRWLAHDRDHFYRGRDGLHGMRSVCKQCTSAATVIKTRARHKRIAAQRAAQLEYAKAAVMRGLLPRLR